MRNNAEKSSQRLMSSACDNNKSLFQETHKDY